MRGNYEFVCGGGCVDSNGGIDPVCAFHGKRWSEHEGGRCLYCCICFKTLTPDECAVDSDGQKWDICKPCGVTELA